VTHQTATTTVKEYDEEGRLVKETTTTSEYDWPDAPAIQTPYVSPYIQPTYRSNPWIYPTIAYRPNTCTSIGQSGTWTVVNGDGEGGEAVSA